MFNHFNSDLINNIDHMRILGTEPKSVILSQTTRKVMPQKSQNKLKPKGMVNHST